MAFQYSIVSFYSTRHVKSMRGNSLASVLSPPHPPSKLPAHATERRSLNQPVFPSLLSSSFSTCTSSPPVSMYLSQLSVLSLQKAVCKYILVLYSSRQLTAAVLHLQHKLSLHFSSDGQVREGQVCCFRFSIEGRANYELFVADRLA